MSDRRPSGPESAAKGAVEEIKGKVKEAIGAVTGNERLKEEGKAQQDKAESEREVAKEEAAAEKARDEAEAHESRQRANQ